MFLVTWFQTKISRNLAKMKMDIIWVILIFRQLIVTCYYINNPCNASCNTYAIIQNSRSQCPECSWSWAKRSNEDWWTRATPDSVNTRTSAWLADNLTRMPIKAMQLDYQNAQYEQYHWNRLLDVPKMTCIEFENLFKGWKIKISLMRNGRKATQE